MSSTEPCASCLRPSQVVLGTTDYSDSLPQGSRHAAVRHRLQLNNVTYLAGRESRDALIVQASFDQVCILSRQQRFDQALPFWDAFSGSQNTDQCISCIAVALSAESDYILIAAAMDHRVAVWTASASASTLSRKWKVHSTLTINDGIVTTLDVKSGQLLIGTTTSLALWRLDSSEIPIWRRFWTKTVPAPISIARFSPDANIIAAVAQGGQHILLWQYQPRATQPPILQQRLYHARPVTGLTWRQPPETSSQADVLISNASDGVARIWAPVIDEPTQLRLWCSVQAPRPAAGLGVVSAFYLDAHVVSAVLRTNIDILQREIQMVELGVGSSNELNAHTLELNMDLKRTRLRRLEQIVNETPDMFVSVENDGSLFITAVANIDRRPPTLLQAFDVLRIPLPLSQAVESIGSISVLPLHTSPDAPSTAPMLILLVNFSSGVSTTYSINPAIFFDGRGSGIEPDYSHPCGPSIPRGIFTSCKGRHTSRIEYLQRSADGSLLISTSAKESIAWTSHAPPMRSMRSKSSLYCQATMPSVYLTAASWNGLLMARISRDGAGEVYRAFDKSTARFSCGEDVKHLTLSCFSGVEILVVVMASGLVHAWALAEAGELRLTSCPPSRLWPDEDTGRRLTLVSSSSSAPDQSRSGLSLVFADSSGRIEAVHAIQDATGQLRWTTIAAFHEPLGTPTLISGSAHGLVALVTRDKQEKETLVILDSKTSSFSSGEEHRQCFSSEEVVVALDWSPSPLSSNVLAVAFEHHVDIVASRRSSPFDLNQARSSPQWQLLVRLDLRICTPSMLRSACWLTCEQLVVASGSLLLIYGPWVQPCLPCTEVPKDMHLAELVAEVGGPVVQYHPTFLLQCAIWGKIGLASAIIGNLEKALLACRAQDMGETWAFEEVSLDAMLKDDRTADQGATKLVPSTQKNTLSSIFDEPASVGDARDTDLFAIDRINTLARHLQEIKPPHVSAADIEVLVCLIKTISEAIREHRSLDASGLRYTLALRQMLNRSSPWKQAKQASAVSLTYRDYLWAFHSHNQETLLSSIESVYHNQLDWPAARATGLFIWLQNPSMLRNQAEAVARAQFMSSEDRDPVKCSLLYFALGKRKVVQGLWRQAVWHPEQKKMLQFLSHDFDEQRWKTAAQKNAFALLSQRRYEFAASFFMLGESLRDAVNVCVRNLDDLPLAIALARIHEGRDDGPVLIDILKTRVLPLAFETGDRWMGSWAFWMLKRRDLAVRIIVTPLRDLLADKDVAVLIGSSITCGNDSYSDPSLALLFQQLRAKSLQTIKGLYDIPEKKVFDFVLNTNRGLCRMGCHSIGLSLLRNWQFEPASVSSASTLFHHVSKHDLETLSRVDQAVLAESTDVFSESSLHDGRVDKRNTSPTSLRRRTSQTTISPPSSPRMQRRRSSLLRRRSSIIDDLDIGATVSAHNGKQDDQVVSASDALTSKSISATREQVRAEPNQDALTTESWNVSDSDAHKKQDGGAKGETAPQPKKHGISIFKSAAASNSQQGAQEFDFSSFGF